jgi:hypothetical protein
MCRFVLSEENKNVFVEGGASNYQDEYGASYNRLWCLIGTPIYEEEMVPRSA